MEKARNNHKRKRVKQSTAYKNIVNGFKYALKDNRSFIKIMTDRFSKPKYNISQLVAFGLDQPEHQECVAREIGKIIFGN